VDLSSDGLRGRLRGAWLEQVAGGVSHFGSEPCFTVISYCSHIVVHTLSEFTSGHACVWPHLPCGVALRGPNARAQPTFGCGPSCGRARSVSRSVGCPFVRLAVCACVLWPGCCPDGESQTGDVCVGSGSDRADLQRVLSGVLQAWVASAAVSGTLLACFASCRLLCRTSACPILVSRSAGGVCRLC
jgi:hypothetical protein